MIKGQSDIKSQNNSNSSSYGAQLYTTKNMMQGIVQIGAVHAQIDVSTVWLVLADPSVRGLAGNLYLILRFSSDWEL